MRSVYHILQKLRDQEKRDRQLAFAEAEAERMKCEANLNARQEALRDNEEMPKTLTGAEAGWNEYLLRQRYFEVLNGEISLKEAEEKSNEKRESLLEAQKESRIMEELIKSMQEEERKQQQIEESKINDELGSMSWWREK